MPRHQHLLLWSLSPLVWVTGTSPRFNSNATSMDCTKLQTDNEAVSNSNRSTNKFKVAGRRLRWRAFRTQIGSRVRCANCRSDVPPAPSWQHERS
jgi:hypothetical protein